MQPLHCTITWKVSVQLGIPIAAVMNDSPYRQAVAISLASLAVAADELLSSDDDAVQRGTRSGSYRRSRVSFLQATSYLSELEYTRAFRMSPESFGQFLLCGTQSLAEGRG
jgi:hypothetical protein